MTLTLPVPLPARILLLGSGELGKEVTIALQRYGCTVIACDSYENASAMQVADESRVFDMRADAGEFAPSNGGRFAGLCPNQPD